MSPNKVRLSNFTFSIEYAQTQGFTNENIHHYTFYHQEASDKVISKSWNINVTEYSKTWRR